LSKRIAALTRGYYAVLAKISLSYSPLGGRSFTCYSPVRHFTQDRSPFLVRLACVRHAASVDSEPGSNSRLILVCMTLQDRGPKVHASPAARKAPEGITSEITQSNFVVPHDWHVQLCCQ